MNAESLSRIDAPAERHWRCLACGKPFRLTVASGSSADESRARR